MTKPITPNSVCCGECGRVMVKIVSGVLVFELKETRADLLQSCDVHRVWSADRFECEDCGNNAIAGFGEFPLAESHERDRIRSLFFSEGEHHYVR